MPSANGSPYRNRTSVAPSVPRSVTRWRCAALRMVWASAVKTVIGIHSMDGERLPVGRGRGQMLLASCPSFVSVFR